MNVVARARNRTLGALFSDTQYRAAPPSPPRRPPVPPAKVRASRAGLRPDPARIFRHSVENRRIGSYLSRIDVPNRRNIMWIANSHHERLRFRIVPDLILRYLIELREIRVWHWCNAQSCWKYGSSPSKLKSSETSIKFS